MPFLSVLVVVPTRALDGRRAPVRAQTSGLRWILLASWCVSPIGYAVPLIGGDCCNGAGGFLLRRTSRSIADVAAAALVGILVHRPARTRSCDEEPWV